MKEHFTKALEADLNIDSKIELNEVHDIVRTLRKELESAADTEENGLHRHLVYTKLLDAEVLMRVRPVLKTLNL